MGEIQVVGHSATHMVNGRVKPPSSRLFSKLGLAVLELPFLMGKAAYMRDEGLGGFSRATDSCNRIAAWTPKFLITPIMSSTSSYTYL